MILRFYSQKDIASYVKPGKVLIVYGPRQVGKTTLITQFLDIQTNYSRVYRGFGENIQLQDLFRQFDVQQLFAFFKGYDLVFIDEAQKLTRVGEVLKVLVDHLPSLSIIVTGSSSFELAQQVGEPLVGRSFVLSLFPIAFLELDTANGLAATHEKLESFLRFGLYPDTLNAETEVLKKEYLNQLVSGYLYKDILELENIRDADKIIDILRLLAFQIGHEVSIQEIATSIGMSKNTVDRYLDLLEKTFVIFKVRGFSRNLRKEITKMSRYYFYDNGVRNTVIQNYNPLALRNDTGQLWENFLFSERMKVREYYKLYANTYFWRTHDQKEVDMVEEREGKLFGFEFKFSAKKFVKPPKLWLETYKNASFEVVHPNNYHGFVSPEFLSDEEI